MAFISNELTLNCTEYPFDWQAFDFLDKSLAPQPPESTTNGTTPRITCFDVNRHFFAFATNSGLIYCFRRHVVDANQLLRYRFTSSAIHAIQLITDHLISFATQSSVYVLNRLNQKFLYGWKCPTRATITCLQTYLAIGDQKLLLISGDSDGCLRYHDLVRAEQSIIFMDTGFPIVQIEFIDSHTLLISTSLRSAVLEIDFNDLHKCIVKQIGKNQRKTFGRFGAVYCQKTDTIYGSRPSLHLIKAQVSGHVSETMKINYMPSSECPQPIPELAQKPITGQTHYKLGVLKMFCDDQYVLSVNDSNLVIIRTDGQFCVKEKIDKLVDVKIAANDTNEAFLLLESKQIIRIRNNQIVRQSDDHFDGTSDYEISSESEGKNSDDNSRKSSTESLINLIKAPVNNGNPLSFIDEELRKVFDFTKIQMKLTEKYNQLSTSIITTIDPNVVPNSDKNVFVSGDYPDFEDTNSLTKEMPDFASPLVITRKPKRKAHHNSSDSLLTSTSDKDKDAMNGLEGNANKIIETSLSSASDLQTNIEVSDKSSDESENKEQMSEENKLEMILSAYKEANPQLETIWTDTQAVEDNGISESTDISVATDDNHAEVSQNDSSDKDLRSNSQQSVEELSVSIEENEIILRPIEHKWEPIICLTDVNSVKNIEFSSVCATGYNSDREMGLIWFVPKAHKSLIYYPTLEALKLNKVQALDITCATNELIVLTDSGVIFRREGMDATKPVGTKWMLIKNNKSKSRITSVSVHTKESILWCCDTNGETWTHTMRPHKWSLINDYNSHSIEMRKVCVSVTDWTVVWGIDRSGKIFVRTFNKSVDQKQDFRGDEWLLMDGILATDIALYDHTVIIAVEGNQLFRRSAKIRQSDSSNEWQPVVVPDIPPEDSVTSVSVTENNDIWIMTATGLVWHTINQLDRHSVKEESDWLII